MLSAAPVPGLLNLKFLSAEGPALGGYLEGSINFMTVFPALKSTLSDPFPAPRIQFSWENSLDYIFGEKPLGRSTGMLVDI